MPSNPEPNLSQADLIKLYKLLSRYAEHIRGEQPMAAEVIANVAKWVYDDIDDPPERIAWRRHPR